ncbi:MAG: hypothetical protein VKL42_23850 [Snowella sp.]|nr:hypothetical protein [Snowella sp.]
MSHSSPNSSQPQEILPLWQQIREDWIAHGQDWTKPGFRAVALQRFGAWRMRIEPKLLRALRSFCFIIRVISLNS